MPTTTHQVVIARRTTWRRVILALALVAAGLLSGSGIAWIVLSPDDTAFVGRTVSVSWGDGKYGPAFYGAWVYLEKSRGGFSVRLRVQIGPGHPMWHDAEELGWVATHEAAVKEWGTITWREEGLYVGTGGPGDFFLPRARLESHR
jgi:hypothetical protein